MLGLIGCTALVGGYDPNNQSQQLIIKTTIQLATATYLSNNSSEDSINLVLEVTDKVMLYVSSEDVYADSSIALQERMHDLIAEMALTVPQKIALTSLSDVILSEAITWAEINIDDTITEASAEILFFCANAMNETAKMYILPDFKGRTYSVNTPYIKFNKAQND